MNVEGNIKVWIPATRQVSPNSAMVRAVADGMMEFVGELEVSGCERSL